MSNIISFSITGDTNAEQVVGRAKTAVNGLDSQLGRISGKFSTAFSSIFLSFLGPMALLGGAMAFIGKMISDNQKKHEDANKAAIEGTNSLMSAEDKYWANKRNNEKNTAKDVEAAKIQRIKTTEEFLATDAADEIVSREMKKRGVLIESSFIRGQIALDPKVQNEVQGLISKEAGFAGAGGSGLSGKAFKSPEGFGNVIGVGANPVLEAMTSQLEEARKTNDILSQIALGGGGRTTTWLNAADSPAPSRAAMLKGK